MLGLVESWEPRFETVGLQSVAEVTGTVIWTVMVLQTLKSRNGFEAETVFAMMRLLNTGRIRFIIRTFRQNASHRALSTPQHFALSVSVLPGSVSRRRHTPQLVLYPELRNRH